MGYLFLSAQIIITHTSKIKPYIKLLQPNIVTAEDCSNVLTIYCTILIMKVINAYESAPLFGYLQIRKKKKRKNAMMQHYIAAKEKSISDCMHWKTELMRIILQWVTLPWY